MSKDILEFFQLDSVQQALLDLWSKIVNVIPDLIAVIFIIMLGLVISPILGGIAKKFCDLIKIDSLLKQAGIHDILKDYSPKLSVSLLIGRLVKWFFILAFVLAAVDILEWNRVGLFINDIILYIPDVLVAVVILVLGVIAGKFMEHVVTRTIQGSRTPVQYPEGYGKLTRWSLIAFALLAALVQLNIAPSLIEILFAGVVFALALAFGLGGREKAASLLNDLDAPKKTKKK